MYGDAYVLKGAHNQNRCHRSWPAGTSGPLVLNPSSNYIEPTEQISGGHIVATYTHLGDPKQTAKLVLSSYAASQNAAETMDTLAGELDSDCVNQQIKAIGIESLAWTRPEPKSTGSGSVYHLLLDKRVGDKDEPQRVRCGYRKMRYVGCTLSLPDLVMMGIWKDWTTGLWR